MHRFPGKTPGPFPLQLLPHQLPTSLCAQVSQGQGRISTAANSLLVLGAKCFMSFSNWVLLFFMLIKGLLFQFCCWWIFYLLAVDKAYLKGLVTFLYGYNALNIFQPVY